MRRFNINIEKLVDTERRLVPRPTVPPDQSFRRMDVERQRAEIPPGINIRELVELADRQEERQRVRLREEFGYRGMEPADKRGDREW